MPLHTLHCFCCKPTVSPKQVTDAVHAKGSFIFLQLWALGRVASPRILKEEGGFDVVGASPIRHNAVTASQVVAMNRSSPENLRAQSSKSTSHYTPRRQRTRSKPVSMASRYMGPMATFWTNSYSLYPTTGRTSTEDRSKIVCASRSKPLMPLWRPSAPNGRGCVSARGPGSKVRRNIARAS